MRQTLGAQKPYSKLQYNQCLSHQFPHSINVNTLHSTNHLEIDAKLLAKQLTIQPHSFLSVSFYLRKSYFYADILLKSIH